MYHEKQQQYNSLIDDPLNQKVKTENFSNMKNEFNKLYLISEKHKNLMFLDDFVDYVKVNKLFALYIFDFLTKSSLNEFYKEFKIFSL